jgi:antitoxin component YwqK of YwqJK toxin-antitoxin module
VFLSTLGFSQSANTVIKTRENENPRYTEIFYVLKSDTSVRHGSYQRLGFNDEIILSGNYRDGKKDSLWVEFLRFSTIILSKGFYRDGEKIGIWEYYDNKGQIQLKYNYDSKQTVYCRKVEEGNVSEMFVKLDTGVVSLRLQRDPFFNGDD